MTISTASSVTDQLKKAPRVAEITEIDVEEAGLIVAFLLAVVKNCFTCNSYFYKASYLAMSAHFPLNSKQSALRNHSFCIQELC